MRYRKTTHRRGAAVVEAALTLPALVIVTLGFIEVGWLVDSHQVLHSAARQGGRTAVSPENSNAEVRAASISALQNSIDIDASVINVRLFRLSDAGAIEYEIQNLNQNESGAAILVEVQCDYQWFRAPSSFFGFSHGPITGSTVMRRQR